MIQENLIIKLHYYLKIYVLSVTKQYEYDNIITVRQAQTFLLFYQKDRILQNNCSVEKSGENLVITDV